MNPLIFAIFTVVSTIIAWGTKRLADKWFPPNEIPPAEQRRQDYQERLEVRFELQEAEDVVDDGGHLIAEVNGAADEILDNVRAELRKQGTEHEDFDIDFSLDPAFIAPVHMHDPFIGRA